MTDIDLLLDEDTFDLTLDEAGEPQLVEQRSTVGQDAKDMILDKFFAVEMIGQRSRIERAALRNDIALELEEDRRIKPGTAEIVETSPGTIQVIADTYNYGPISITAAIAL